MEVEEGRVGEDGEGEKEGRKKRQWRRKGTAGWDDWVLGRCRVGQAGGYSPCGSLSSSPRRLRSPAALLYFIFFILFPCICTAWASSSPASDDLSGRQEISSWDDNMANLP